MRPVAAPPPIAIVSRGQDRRRQHGQFEEDAPLPRRARQWGNVARRGAREVARRDTEDERRSSSYDADEKTRRRGTKPPGRQAEWVRVDAARNEWADPAPARARRGGSRRGGTGSELGPAASVGRTGTAVAALASLSSKRTLPPEIATEIRNAADVATAVHREHLVERAESAWGSYERGRFQDALRAIKPLTEETPQVPAVRELAGLAAYRAGRWREAARHLRALDALADATEHLPVLMDCERALGKRKKVAELWAELRHRSPDPEVLAEGRIVAAACLADSGDLDDAIAMLASAGASKALRNPSDRHIRQWYLLADLYERAGDVPAPASTSTGCCGPTPRRTTRRSDGADSARSDEREVGRGRSGSTEVRHDPAAEEDPEPLSRRDDRDEVVDVPGGS